MGCGASSASPPAGPAVGPAGPPAQPAPPPVPTFDLPAGHGPTKLDRPAFMIAQFRAFDDDGDGAITVNEFMKQFDTADIDGDGVVDDECKKKFAAIECVRQSRSLACYIHIHMSPPAALPPISLLPTQRCRRIRVRSSAASITTARSR